MRACCMQHACVHIYIHTYLYVCMYSNTQTHMHKCIHTNVNAHRLICCIQRHAFTLTERLPILIWLFFQKRPMIYSILLTKATHTLTERLPILNQCTARNHRIVRNWTSDVLIITLYGVPTISRLLKIIGLFCRI